MVQYSHGLGILVKEFHMRPLRSTASNAQTLQWTVIEGRDKLELLSRGNIEGWNGLSKPN